jgi:hypothetical protein
MNKLGLLAAEDACQASDLEGRVRAGRPASGPKDMAAAGFDDVARERPDVTWQESCDGARHGDGKPASDLILDERRDNPWNALLVRLCDVENSQGRSPDKRTRRLRCREFVQGASLVEGRLRLHRQPIP